MANEAGDVYALQPFGTAPHERRNAGIIVCRNARNRAEAEQLLEMIGLQGEDRPPLPGCRACGGPVPDWATAPKCGMHGCCSAACKRLFLAGEKVEVPAGRVSADPARKHVTALLDITKWTAVRVSRESAVHVDVIRGLVATTDTHRLQTISSIDADRILSIPIPDPAPRSDRDWRAQAKCFGEDPERWFPLGKVDQDAIDACKACPVRVDCARFAKSTATHGVHAGYLLPDERQQLIDFIDDVDRDAATVLDLAVAS